MPRIPGLAAAALCAAAVLSFWSPDANAAPCPPIADKLAAIPHVDYAGVQQPDVPKPRREPAPAAERDTWSTPKNLPAGTYTYFCRVRPFMRASFRVVGGG